MSKFCRFNRAWSSLGLLWVEVTEPNGDLRMFSARRRRSAASKVAKLCGLPFDHAKSRIDEALDGGAHA